MCVLVARVRWTGGGDEDEMVDLSQTMKDDYSPAVSGPGLKCSFIGLLWASATPPVPPSWYRMPFIKGTRSRRIPVVSQDRCPGGGVFLQGVRVQPLFSFAAPLTGAGTPPLAVDPVGGQ